MSVDFFGTKISWICIRGQLSVIDEMIKSKVSCYVTYTNVHVIVTSKNNTEFRQAINSANLVSPDGMPLVKLGKRAGAKCMEKCSGPDMIKNVIEHGLDKGYTHYFYGSTEDTLEKLESSLLIKYPTINIAGKYSPPFRPLTLEEDEAIIREINQLNPDCIWIGLGAPKQEIWMYNHRGKIKKGVMFGVGAAFDFHAEIVNRAPVWMQKNGLEWLYRLVKEPRRLWKRYFVTNFLFLWYVIRYDIKVENVHTCRNTDKTHCVEK